MIDQKTAHLGLPLPHLGNLQDDDVPRMRAALGLVDAAAQRLDAGLQTKAEAAALRDGLATVITQLGHKADASTVASDLAKKADKEETKAELAALIERLEGMAATATPAPGATPKAGPDGKLAAGWLPELASQSVLMTITPTVSANVAAGYENRLILQGKSALVGVAVTQYRITCGAEATATVAATAGVYTGSFVPTGAAGDGYTITVVAIDSLNNESAPLTLQLTIVGASITPPSVLAPIASSQIIRSLITITTEAFTSVGLDDTHVKSRYRIRKADDDSVIYDSGEVDSLISHSIAEAQLAGLTEECCQVIIDAQHLGSIGWSGWGAARVVELIGKGTRIDGKATVIGLMTGYPAGVKNQWVAVLDAAHRGISVQWGKYGTDLTGLPNLNTGAFTWVGGTIAPDESVDSIIAKTRDPQTSKTNTDYLMTQHSGNDSQGIVGVPAAAHCRAIAINGSTAQLPNHQTLAFVFSRREFVDANDPTADANAVKKLANWGFGSANGARVWASSEYYSLRLLCGLQWQSEQLRQVRPVRCCSRLGDTRVAGLEP